MNIKYIDIHSHLNFPEYDNDREEVIARMKEKGVATITVGTSLETSQSAVALAEQHDNIFACIGIHPTEKWSKGIFDTFENLVKHPKVVAVGECGLDYGREGKIDEQERFAQQELFEAHIRFAAWHNLPLMLHVRNATEDVLATLITQKAKLKEEFPDYVLRGNAHFFVGTPEEAARYIELGFTVSFTGVITFTHDYDETVRSVPIGNLMSETDSPFVSPIPYRGKRNESTHVIEVVRKIAEIRGIDEETVSQEILKTAVAKWNLVW